jgi:hypothetical protein
MQLAATVEVMGITDRQATGIARAGLLTVNDREHPLEGDPRENLLDGLLQRLDLTVTQRAIPGRQGSAEPLATGAAPTITNAVCQAAGRGSATCRSVLRCPSRPALVS